MLEPNKVWYNSPSSLPRDISVPLVPHDPRSEENVINVVAQYYLSVCRVILNPRVLNSKGIMMEKFLIIITIQNYSYKKESVA
jgi:hypothetical protein